MVTVSLLPSSATRAQRPRTLSTRGLKRQRRNRALPVLPNEGAALDDARPQSRAECRDGPRPCLWVSCRFHLYLDVNEATGSLKLNFPHLEPWELPESCALDIAERGGLTLEEIGALLNLTRERARQIERAGLEKLKDDL
jgi:Sigma-70, region 4